MHRPPPRDPLAPIEVVVSAFLTLGLGLTALVLCLGVVEHVATGRTDVSLATIGDPEACATTRPGAVPYGGSGDGSEGVVGLRDGARAFPEKVQVCLAHPTLAQKAASVVRPLGALVFGLGSLWLVLRMIRTARRQGLFTAPVAGRTRTLGWWLLLMGVGYPVLGSVGDGIVLAAAVKGVSWTVAWDSPGISVVVVTVALGVISVARVLEHAVPLQQEVDATI